MSPSLLEEEVPTVHFGNGLEGLEAGPRTFRERPVERPGHRGRRTFRESSSNGHRTFREWSLSRGRPTFREPSEAPR
jgi:hypothetical protein